MTSVWVGSVPWHMKTHPSVCRRVFTFAKKPKLWWNKQKLENMTSAKVWRLWLPVCHAPCRLMHEETFIRICIKSHCTLDGIYHKHSMTSCLCFGVKVCFSSGLPVLIKGNGFLPTGDMGVGWQPSRAVVWSTQPEKTDKIKSRFCVSFCILRRGLWAFYVRWNTCKDIFLNHL